MKTFQAQLALYDNHNRYFELIGDENLGEEGERWIIISADSQRLLLAPREDGRAISPHHKGSQPFTRRLTLISGVPETENKFGLSPVTVNHHGSTMEILMPAPEQRRQVRVVRRRKKGRWVRGADEEQVPLPLAAAARLPITPAPKTPPDVKLPHNILGSSFNVPVSELAAVLLDWQKKGYAA